VSAEPDRLNLSELPDTPGRVRAAFLPLSELWTGARFPQLEAPVLDPEINVCAEVQNAVAAVDWGDGVDYGPEVFTPTRELRATTAAFVVRISLQASQLLGRRLPLPEFAPAADGTIDVHWGADGPLELLLNIHEAGETASFFGRSASGGRIKGNLRLAEDNLYLAAWLLQKQ
jgi:hypothetical protein